jgi:hypothetical protein
LGLAPHTFALINLCFAAKRNEPVLQLLECLQGTRKKSCTKITAELASTNTILHNPFYAGCGIKGDPSRIELARLDRWIARSNQANFLWPFGQRQFARMPDIDVFANGPRNMAPPGRPDSNAKQDLPRTGRQSIHPCSSYFNITSSESREGHTQPSARRRQITGRAHRAWAAFPPSNPFTGPAAETRQQQLSLLDAQRS